MTSSSTTLLNAIIDLEWEMQNAVRTTDPAGGPDGEKSFRLMRQMTHSVLPRELLAGLLAHLEQARAEGRNVMTEKYARMEGLIPPLSDSPLIARIADLEQAWLRAVQRLYPLTFPGVDDAFRAHLTAELETFPEAYLQDLYAFVAASREAGRNLVEERYELLFKHLGYESIQARERKALLDSRKCGSCC